MGPWLIMLLAASPMLPSAQQAEAFARHQSWDQLLLTFSPAPPASYSPRDAATISRALTHACEALLNEDAVLAFDLGTHAAAFQPSPSALLCWAGAAGKTHQGSSAEQALKSGRQKYPRDGRFGLELGRALLAQGELLEATQALEAVPKRSPQNKAARALLLQAQAQLRGEASARRNTAQLETQVESGQAGAATLPATPAQTTGMRGLAPTVEVGAESGIGPGEMRTRDNRYFHFKYFNNSRDFAQRAEFEGQVASALDAARIHSAAQIGVFREAPVDVILYTREEYVLHFGEAQARNILGTYQDNSIRINGGLEVTAAHQATVAHEYIHAVVAEISGWREDRIPTWMNEGLAEYVEWRFQGKDQADLGFRKRLATLARQNALPSLADLQQGPLVGHADPGTLYAFSAEAAGLLVRQAGANAYVRALRSLGSGEPLDKVFPAEFGMTLEELQQRLSSELASR